MPIHLPAEWWTPAMIAADCPKFRGSRIDRCGVGSACMHDHVWSVDPSSTHQQSQGNPESFIAVVTSAANGATLASSLKTGMMTEISGGSATIIGLSVLHK